MGHVFVVGVGVISNISLVVAKGGHRERLQHDHYYTRGKIMTINDDPA